MTPSVAAFPGEHLRAPERLVVAPVTGVFAPLPPETITSEGEIVCAGQAIGTIVSSGDSVPVTSAFTGFLMGVLALEGERVREGQPIAWLRAADITDTIAESA